MGGSRDADGIYQAWRWTSATGLQGLGFLPGSTESVALGINRDGSIIVGYNAYFGRVIDEGFRWTVSVSAPCACTSAKSTRSSTCTTAPRPREGSWGRIDSGLPESGGSGPRKDDPRQPRFCSSHPRPSPNAVKEAPTIFVRLAGFHPCLLNGETIDQTNRSHKS